MDKRIIKTWLDNNGRVRQTIEYYCQKIIEFEIIDEEKNHEQKHPYSDKV